MRNKNIDKTFESTPEFAHFKEKMSALLKVSKKDLDKRVEEHDKNSTRKRSVEGTERKAG